MDYEKLDRFVEAALDKCADDIKNQIVLIAAREMRPLAHEVLYLLHCAVNQYLDDNHLKYYEDCGALLTYQEYQDWKKSDIPF